MNPTARHVDLVRKAWRCPAWLTLTEAPKRLTPELERACIERLQPWLSRIAEVRARYDSGTLTAEERANIPPSGQRRQAGYFNACMRKEELEAAFTLYTALAAYVAKLTAEALRRFPMRTETGRLVPTLTLEDVLSESIELFYLTLSSYDPTHSSGAGVVTYLGLDLPSKLTNAIRTSCVEERPLEAEHLEIAASPCDTEHAFDPAAWAERLTRENPRAQAIWRGLTGTME